MPQLRAGENDQKNPGEGRVVGYLIFLENIWAKLHLFFVECITITGFKHSSF